MQNKNYLCKIKINYTLCALNIENVYRLSEITQKYRINLDM